MAVCDTPDIEEYKQYLYDAVPIEIRNILDIFKKYNFYIGSPVGIRFLNSPSLGKRWDMHHGIDINQRVDPIRGTCMVVRGAPLIQTKDVQAIRGFGNYAQIGSYKDARWVLSFYHLESPPLVWPYDSPPSDDVYNQEVGKSLTQFINKCFMATETKPLIVVWPNAVYPTKIFLYRYAPYARPGATANDGHIYTVANTTVITRDKPEFQEYLNKAKEQIYLLPVGTTGYSGGVHYHVDLKYKCVYLNIVEVVGLKDIIIKRYVVSLDKFCTDAAGADL
ncbi:MAG: hypothetical protein QXF12_00510 [Candidatus Aenigmatarchaeota archaeon]